MEGGEEIRPLPVAVCPERIAALSAEEAKLPSTGQALEARFQQQVNLAAFTGP